MRVGVFGSGLKFNPLSVRIFDFFMQDTNKYSELDTTAHEAKSGVKFSELQSCSAISETAQAKSGSVHNLDI